MKDKKNINKKFFTLNRREFLITGSTATILASCDNDPSHISPDAGVDADADIDNEILDDGDIFDGDIEDDTDDGDSTVVDPRPTTTVSEKVVGVLEEAAQFEEFREQYGLTKKIPGEPYQERDDLNALSLSNGATANPSSLAYFVQMTDIHILDEESPARVIHSPVAADSAWRPQESYSLQLLNAAINTINEFAAVRKPDFVFFTGDLVDDHLTVELTSFIDVIEGNLVDPDTGEDDDPRASGLPDPHDPFQANGLDPSLDWYACLGNHDKWVLGSLGTDITASPTGDSATLWLSDYVEPTCFDDPPCINGYCYSPTPDRCHVPTDDSYFSSSYVPPDPNRAYLDSQSWMMHIIASTKHGPAGHGFEQDNVDNDYSYWYKLDPIPGIPVSLITLDTTSSCTATNRATGDMDAAQMAWLEDRLAFLENENRLVIVVSHHPEDEVLNVADELMATLADYPNVILHVVGHGHRNKVYPHPAPSGMQPYHGYWEIQAPSNIDWPQQIRLHEIVDVGDGTGIIYATLVDLDIPAGDTSEGGRFYSLLDVQEGRAIAGLSGEITDRNVALRFAFPPAMIPILAGLPKRDVESLHFIPEKK